MATKSINKSISVRSKRLGRSLANALEDSKASSAPKPTSQSTFQRIEKNDIKSFLGKTVK